MNKYLSLKDKTYPILSCDLVMRFKDVIDTLQRYGFLSGVGNREGRKSR